MSSGTDANVGEVGALLRSDAAGSAVTSGVVNRQLELNRRWSFYRCGNYDKRELDWNGRRRPPPELIASGSYIPPGYYDAGDQMAPLEARKPSAPYYLGKVIVNRFTGLLFGSKRHPQIVVPDDPRTADWLNGFIEVTRFWARMVQARTYGGAMGSVALGFAFHHGKPRVEVHDPRWCTPNFVDREELILESLEKRYQYQDMIRDPETGTLVEAWFWYRRVIDNESDEVWAKVPVTDQEPNWKRYRSTRIEHNLGFCPVVWMQNTENAEDIDGDPDAHGCFENIEALDMLVAQANRGTLANCDPTLVISTPDEMDGMLQKGSGQAIKFTQGSATYLEIQGSGPKAAWEAAEKLEGRILRVARCVLDDNFAGPARTEKEVDQNYSNMLEQADVLREQYGEKGIKYFFELVLRAAHKLSAASVDRSGAVPAIVRGTIKLPVNKDTRKPRELGEGELIELDWPSWYDPSLDDAKKAVDAAGAAINYGLMDKAHAVRFIAEHFRVEDVDALIKQLEEADKAAMEAQNAPAETYTEPTEPVEPAAEEQPALDGMSLDIPPEVGEALNGAQVTALVDVLEKVYAKTIPAQAAKELILGAYPQLDEYAVDQMVFAQPQATPDVPTKEDAAPADTAPADDAEPEMAMAAR